MEPPDLELLSTGRLGSWTVPQAHAARILPRSQSDSAVDAETVIDRGEKDGAGESAAMSPAEAAVAVVAAAEAQSPEAEEVSIVELLEAGVEFPAELAPQPAVGRVPLLPPGTHATISGIPCVFWYASFRN